MRINLNGRKFVKIGDKKPSEQLMEVLNEEGKKIKISIPFQADGFKSTKNPTQPDGITPIVVEKANLNIKIEEVKKIEEKDIKKTSSKKKK